MAHDLAHDVTEPIGATQAQVDEQTADTQADKLVGANEAARFLGIHRSTLHQAVKNGVITPDLTTQGGHFRFSRATLDTFAVRIAREPVTTLSELLPELTTTLGAPDGRRMLCLKAYERIHHALPDLTVFAVLGLKLHARSLLDLEVVASVRFPDWYLPELIANIERKDYEVTHVLRTLRPRYFEDTATAEGLKRSTRLLARRGALHALAIIPLTQDGEARGVLSVGSLHARKFRTPDVAFLQNTADELAIALACHDYMDSARAQILTSGALMREALRLRADSCCPDKHAERIAPLVKLFREATGADTVSLSAPGVDLVSDDEARSLMRRVSRRDSTATRRWDAPDAATTAIATLAPLNTRTNVVAAAEWTTEIIRQQEFEALLYVFAAASAIALGLDGRARKTVRAPAERAPHAAAVANLR
jgi:excisionase family DNA binding protein